MRATKTALFEAVKRWEAGAVDIAHARRLPKDIVERLAALEARL